MKLLALRLPLSLVPACAALLLGGCLSSAPVRPAPRPASLSPETPGASSAALAWAQRDDEDEGAMELSLGAGLLGRGKTEVEDVVNVSDNEIYGKVSLDWFDESDSVGVGVFVDAGQLDYKVNPGEVTFTTVGLAVKGRYGDWDLGEDVKLLLTPGVGVGYRVDHKGGAGMALNFGIDVRTRFESFDLFVEPGVLTQPTGDDSGRSVTFGPMPYVLLGAGIRF